MYNFLKIKVRYCIFKFFFFLNTEDKRGLRLAKLFIVVDYVEVDVIVIVTACLDGVWYNKVEA